MILAGDIGGTHTRLAFFDAVDGRFSLVSASIFPSREYSGLDEIVTKFVDTSNLHPDTACFGIAGLTSNRFSTIDFRRIRRKSMLLCIKHMVSSQ